MGERLRPHTDYLYLHLMGEPLLHPHLAEILERAEKLKFRVMITTNGTLLGEREDLLCSSPAVEKVSISLHSFGGNEGVGTLEDYLAGCLAFARRSAELERSVPCGCGIWTGRTPEERRPGMETF